MHYSQSTPITLELVVEAVREVLPRRRKRIELTIDTRLEEDLGMTSLDVSEVFVRLEELVGCPLDTAQAEETRTIGQLLALRIANEERAW